MEGLDESHLTYFAIPERTATQTIMKDQEASRLISFSMSNRIIKTVYVAGPLTPISGTENHAIEYLVNMRNMVTAARKLLMAGYYPFVPAFDFLFFMILPEGAKYCCDEVEISGPQIKNYSMEWLRRCDAILLLPGWSKSKGSIAEFYEAINLGIPTFSDIEDLILGVPNAVSF